MNESEAFVFLRELPGYSVEAEEQLSLLVELLRNENERQNLIAHRTMDEVWVRHIADSAQLLRFVPRGTSTWMDLGSGAGFPGLVIAILRPDLRTLLIESRTRRVEWLNRAAERLGLVNVAVAGGRLELLDAAPVEAISARAFAPLERLVDLAARFSTSETLWLLPKGRSAGQELEQLIGWRHMFHVEPSVTDPEAGIIVGRLLGRRGKRL